MNKAFVRDSEDADEDEVDEDEVDEAAPALPGGSNNYVTPRGHAALRAEFERLVKVERPNLVQVVSWAASNGDRSENGDYIYGKKRLREIDRRIRFLAKRLESAVVVDPARQENRDQVFFGATVVVCDEAGGEAIYRIVGIDEAEPGAGHISWISPLARALIKARAGDLVRFESPGGVRELEIVDIRYE
ncbi:MAG: transcription elongation factor GreB [Betaproteobacteria bacterium HGW-Betaproteobacteria-11]|nr:MAG: transcription elongation factor GreB [Betaproteobacteria bacterium HGW-Betaproteobacteria-11]